MKDTTWWISPEQDRRRAHTYILNTESKKLRGDTPIFYMYGG